MKRTCPIIKIPVRYSRTNVLKEPEPERIFSEFLNELPQLKSLLENTSGGLLLANSSESLYRSEVLSIFLIRTIFPHFIPYDKVTIIEALTEADYYAAWLGNGLPITLVRVREWTGLLKALLSMKENCSRSRRVIYAPAIYRLYLAEIATLTTLHKARRLLLLALSLLSHRGRKNSCYLSVVPTSFKNVGKLSRFSSAILDITS